MNKTTGTPEQRVLQTQAKQLLIRFQTASQQLRRGEDLAGIDSLLLAMDELEHWAASAQTAQLPQIDLSRLLSLVRAMNRSVQNQDISGIADLLEDGFCPLIDAWLREWENI